MSDYQAILADLRSRLDAVDAALLKGLQEGRLAEVLAEKKREMVSALSFPLEPR